MSKELDRRQTFAANTAAIPQNCAAAFGRITAQEAVLPFPAPLRGLVLSFHKSIKVTTGW